MKDYIYLFMNVPQKKIERCSACQNAAASSSELIKKIRNIFFILMLKSVYTKRKSFLVEQ